MSSGPEGPGGPNQNEPIGLGALNLSLSMGPRGSCYARGILTKQSFSLCMLYVQNTQYYKQEAEKAGKCWLSH